MSEGASDTRRYMYRKYNELRNVAAALPKTVTRYTLVPSAERGMEHTAHLWTQHGPQTTDPVVFVRKICLFRSLAAKIHYITAFYTYFRAKKDTKIYKKISI